MRDSPDLVLRSVTANLVPNGLNFMQITYYVDIAKGFQGFQFGLLALMIYYIII